MREILEGRKRDAENEEKLVRLQSQNNELKMKLAESKRELELKRQEANRFEHELSTIRQPTDRSTEANPQLKGQIRPQLGAASQGKGNLILCWRR